MLGNARVVNRHSLTSRTRQTELDFLRLGDEIDLVLDVDHKQLTVATEEVIIGDDLETAALADIFSIALRKFQEIGYGRRRRFGQVLDIRHVQPRQQIRAQPVLRCDFLRVTNNHGFVLPFHNVSLFIIMDI